MSDLEDHISTTDSNVSETFIDINLSFSYDGHWEDVVQPNEHESDDEDDEESFYDDDDEFELIDGWLHEYNNYDIQLTKDDPVDELLNTVFKEEVRHVEKTTRKLTDSCSLNEIMNLFLSPLVTVIVRAANASAISSSEKINNDDAANFIRCLIALSIYRVTPSKFFQKHRLFPVSKELNKNQWQKVFYRLKQKSQLVNEDSEIFWDKPFTEDPSIREGEESMGRVNRQFFLPDVSILSTADDHLRLSSSDCEGIGLPRKNNPKKAFGPVSTGIVSLTTGITLANRIAGRGESDVDTIKILCQNLFNKPLANQVETSNLFAMDRGYLSASMIDYIDSIGGSIIGTHKRVQTYPFTFGYDIVDSKRVNIQERGAKMTYWATKKADTSSGKDHKALAYRSGKDHVATVFTTFSKCNPGGFIYKLKRNAVIPQIPSKIRRWMNENYVSELTYGQGGCEWHFIRSGLGIITSTVASIIFNASYLDDEFASDHNVLAPGLGAKMFRPIPTEDPQYTSNELIVMTIEQLREICREYGQKVSGNKDELIRRVLAGRINKYISNEFLIKNKLMSTWFMPPIQNTSMKIGQRCEPQIANKIAQFTAAGGVTISSMIEVGLVKSNTSRYIATSVDRLCVLSLYDPNDLEEYKDGVGNELGMLEKIVAIEIKCMTNKRTRENAIKRIAKYDGSFQKCDFGDSTFLELVWSLDYRTQVLHHVCTYNIDKLLFVVGSQKEIIYIAFIHFPHEILHAYKRLLENFGNKYISWYHNDREIKKFLQHLDLQHAVDIPTVLFWKKMANKLVELNSSEGTRLAPAHDIVPHAISLWNKCKGGQDVVSRQLKNVKVDFRQLKPRAYIIIRQVMTQLLNVHLVNRICCFVRKNNNHNNNYNRASYYTSKHRLNCMKSFSDSLEDMFKCWKYKELCIQMSNYERKLEKEKESIRSENITVDEQSDIRSRIPKNWRLKFFNSADGKKFRMSAASSTDHLPVTSTANRCLLCDGNTTVLCGTCNVQLCKFPFGRNDLSCFEKFHGQETLCKLKRQGNTHKKHPMVEGSVRKKSIKKTVQKPVKKVHPTWFKPRQENESVTTVNMPRRDGMEATLNNECELKDIDNVENEYDITNCARKIDSKESGDSSDDSFKKSKRKYKKRKPHSSQCHEDKPSNLVNDDDDDQKLPSKKPNTRGRTKAMSETKDIVNAISIEKQKKYNKKNQ